MILDALERGWLVGALALLVALELWRPRRATIQGRGLRWPTNLAIGSLNVLLTTLTLAPIAVAAVGADRSWGVLNQLSLPWSLGVALAVVVLDALTYLQHRLLHAKGVLWRVHRVHHADVDLDATSGLRFHPIEALITQATTVAAIVVLGLPPAGVAAYLWLSTIITLLTHANLRVPRRLEGAAQWVVVTPAMHAIHHSAQPEESERNFSTLFSVWDRIGGTFDVSGDEARRPARVGLAEFRETRYLTLPWTLALPFCGSPAGSAATIPESPGHPATR